MSGQAADVLVVRTPGVLDLRAVRGSRSRSYHDHAASAGPAGSATRSPIIGAAIADANAAARISQQAADARVHAAEISFQATAAASQAQISAAQAADEIHGLAGCLDHIANDRSQDLTAASAASDASQACNAQIAQAHADLADVGTPTQALSGGPTAEREVAWSTLGQASSSGDAGDTHGASMQI